MKLLKSYSAYSLALLLAGATAFSGCSKDELPGMEPADDKAADTFNVSVSDDGYASPDAGPNTRAAENNYQTAFTAGDRIGVYAVKDSKVANGVANLCLTAKSNGKGGLVWTDADGHAPQNLPGATYYAYYPYQSAALTVNPAATTAEGFFAGLISGWTPATDQSTYDKYTAQDLMVAKGAPNGGKNLSFSMQHRMALVVIDLPDKARYSLSTDNTYQWEADVPKTTFSDISPWNMNGGIHRYLMKPNGTSGVSGVYNDGSDTKKWQFSFAAEAGKYKVLKVDGGSDPPISISYTLRVGDFYMKDGSLLSSKANLTEQQKKDCIGIVFWVGDATAKDRTLKADHPGCTHGLAVALRGSGQSGWQSPDKSVQEWLDSKQNGKFLPVQSSGEGAGTPMCNIQGYNNTKAIEAFNADAANQNNIVQPIAQVAEYRASVPAPDRTSDWYWPSVKELSLLSSGKDVDNFYSSALGGDNFNAINGILNKLGGNASQLERDHHWPSTERDGGSAYYILLYNCWTNSSAKYNGSFNIRCVLAF